MVGGSDEICGWLERNGGWHATKGELIRTAYQAAPEFVDEKKQATHANGQPVSFIE
jgi:hypothetical protein